MIEPAEKGRTVGNGYQSLNPRTLVGYLSTRPGIAERLGGQPLQWHAHERGDGNLNLVFLVTGGSGALVVKQALPYVRMVGPSWPLSLARSHFERTALVEQAGWGRDFVPAVYDFDRAMALIVMEYLASHVVLRKGLLNEARYPLVGRHVGQFLASALFHTSDLQLRADEKKRLMTEFLGNSAMCKISEDLIFDEPYYSAPMNRHTSPALDEMAGNLKSDIELKLAAQEMKWRFLNHPECLVHGDLHTGSVMVTERDTRIIDPEFAFYGPVGFDLGVFLGNLLMSYLSQTGYEIEKRQRQEQRQYLLDQISTLWACFVESFTQHWQRRGGEASAGTAYNPRLFLDAPALRDRGLERRLAAVWDDSLGFAGCEMIRRIVGLSHVEDFEGIADLHLRAHCELQTVAMARQLLVHRSRFASITDVLDLVRTYS